MLLKAVPLLVLLLYSFGLTLLHAPLTNAMAYRAKSDYEKAQIRRIAKENLIRRAVDTYRDQPEGSRSHRRGYRTITDQVMDDYEAETGGRIYINWATVRKRDEGTRSLHEARAADALLTPDEDQLLTRFLKETADRGFPCNNKRIIEAALAIVRQRDPLAHIGESWVTRFLARKRARKELSKYWSRPLKSVRGGAVNPTNHKEYFDLLESLFAEYGFEEDCIYGGDESCFQKGVWHAQSLPSSC